MVALLKRLPGRGFVIGVPFAWLLLFFLLPFLMGGKRSSVRECSTLEHWQRIRPLRVPLHYLLPLQWR
jgi:hypothetical protein